MVPIVPPTLTDGAITVRGLRGSDVPALVRACQDPDIPRWTRVPSPYTPEDARALLAAAATEAAAGSGVALAVAEAGDGLIGTIGLMGLDRAGPAEIGYWIARDARGGGAATRAVRLVCDWAARTLGVARVEILAHHDNAASQRVAERAGFIATGETRAVARMPPDRREGYRVYTWTAAGSPP